MESAEGGQDCLMNFCYAKIHPAIFNFDIYILHFSRSKQSEERRYTRYSHSVSLRLNAS